MKVLLINGSPHPNGCTATALREVEKQLQKHQIETTLFHIGNDPIQGCMACGFCKKNGRCVCENDTVNECAELMRRADGLVIGSPVYYAGPSGALCALLDRAFYIVSREMSMKPGAAVASCRRAGSTATLDRLNKYFTICNMPVVSSQYWNEIHGNTPDEVVKDLEGMQTMRTLGDNMAFLCKAIELGKQNLPPLEREQKIMTNFIR